MAQATVAWRGASKTYGRHQALKPIDLEIQPGRVTAILGENGAGKTTAIKLALGLITASTGEVNLAGYPAGHDRARQRVGTMLQDATVPPLLSGRELLHLAASYYPAPAAPDEVINELGLKPFADRPTKTLSGGQQRRIQFALAIVGRPDVLFLDEPTAGLDEEARRRLWDTVRNAAANERTIVLTTHYLEEADALADRVVVLRTGEIAADAPTSVLRDTVAGSIIQCITALSPDRIRAFPAVARVVVRGRYIEASSTDATATLKAWLAADPALHELTVSKPSLADALAVLDEAAPETVS